MYIVFINVRNNLILDPVMLVRIDTTFKSMNV